MKKRMIICLMGLMAASAQAATSSLTMTFSVAETYTQSDGTVHYELVLNNQNITGANSATVDVTFNPPGPTGAAGAYGPPVVLDTGITIPVGATRTYNYDGAGGAVAKPALAVDLGAIPLNPGVAVAYALAAFNGVYDADPVYDAIDSRNIPVEVLNPCIDVTKSVEPTTSKEGDEVTYRICIRNCSDPFTPLYNVTVIDDELDDLSSLFPNELLDGTEVCIDYLYVIQGDDPDPLINVVTASGEDVTNFAVTDTNDAEVDLVDPNFEVTKVCLNAPVPFGDDAEFEITITNTGDVDLIITTDEPAIPGPLPLPQVGPPFVQVVTRPVVEPGVDVCNIIDVNATLPPELNLDNVLERSSDDCCLTTLPPEPCIEIEKRVDCDVSKEGDEVTYTICIKNCGPTDINEITSLTDTKLPGDLKALMEVQMGEKLAPDEEICIDVPFVMPSGPDPFVNEASVAVEDIHDSVAVDGPVSASVDLVHPSFIVDKSCRTQPLQVGDVAIFDITVDNTGDICLHFDLDDLGDPCVFDLPAGGSVSFETNVLVETEEDITNTLIGTATLLPGVDGQCGDPCDCLTNEYPVNAEATCEVSGGATRTPGFWKTHYYIAEDVFENCADTEPNLDLGWTHVENIDEMMAIFWAKKAKLNKLCQARLQASFHFMAAVLNDCMPDGLDFESYTGLTKEGVATTMAGCDETAIKDLIGILGGYNEAGDDVEVVFPAGLEAYNAQPKYAREQAEGIFKSDFEDDCEACTNGMTATSTKGSKGKGPK